MIIFIQISYFLIALHITIDFLCFEFDYYKIKKFLNYLLKL